jgi:hypothetical protein
MLDMTPASVRLLSIYIPIRSKYLESRKPPLKFTVDTPAGSADSRGEPNVNPHGQWIK